MSSPFCRCRRSVFIFSFAITYFFSGQTRSVRVFWTNVLMTFSRGDKEKNNTHTQYMFIMYCSPKSPTDNLTVSVPAKRSVVNFSWYAMRINRRLRWSCVSGDQVWWTPMFLPGTLSSSRSAPPNQFKYTHTFEYYCFWVYWMYCW